ncbi:MAG: hypothetical protein AAGJ96_02585 [Pseudomonadota bacterium]
MRWLMLAAALAGCGTLGYYVRATFVDDPFERVAVEETVLAEPMPEGVRSFAVSTPERYEAVVSPGRSMADAQNVKSVSKVLLASVVGELGLDLDAPIQTISGCDVPGRLSLRMLLNMEAGFAYRENADNHVFRAENWTCRILALPLAVEHGQRFNYGTVQSHLVSAHLHDRGVDVPRAIEALGFDVARWVESPEGAMFGGSELWVSPAALHRFGERVVRGEVAQAHWRSVQATPGPYALGWWRRDYAGATALVAEGFGGQVLALFDDGMVVSATSPTGGDVEARLAVVREMIVCARRGGTAVDCATP